MAKSNPIILRPGAGIGNSSAEADDEFLFECFFDHPAYESAQDIESNKFILNGRTGSGKTALLRMIARQNEHVSEINLQDLALEYVANSDVIRFLDALGINLGLFYQALWKHVFCIEYIRMRFSIDNPDKSKTLFESIRSAFDRDHRKKKAVEYLKRWQSQFWITMDENIREITEGVENSVNAELGGELMKFKANAGYARTLSSEKRSQLVARAKKVVDSKQLTDLAAVLDLLSDYESTGRIVRRHYILVDRLDENWIDESIRYSLIRGLVDCLRSFGRIRDLKIIASLRSDVLERVLAENSDAGFQREKYDDYLLRLKWSKDQLRSLVNKRINFLFRKKYSKENVFFDDIFDSKVGAIKTFDYICDRTLLRPRDVISFINTCLEEAQGDTRVPQKTIRASESVYSQVRLQALKEEWQGAFPSIAIALDLISGRGSRFQPSEIGRESFTEDFILQAADIQDGDRDPLVKLSKSYLKDSSADKIFEINNSILSILYRIGAVGLKLEPSEPYRFSYKDAPLVPENLIPGDVKVSIHPMLFRSLNVDDRAT